MRLTLRAFREISPASRGKSVSPRDLASALPLGAHHGKGPFRFQKLCLSLNCFCSALEGVLPPSSGGGWPSCTGSISRDLSRSLVPSPLHPVLGLFFSCSALPRPHSVTGSHLPTTWRHAVSVVTFIVPPHHPPEPLQWGVPSSLSPYPALQSVCFQSSSLAS